jgi:hypothetical protein
MTSWSFPDLKQYRKSANDTGPSNLGKHNRRQRPYRVGVAPVKMSSAAALPPGELIVYPKYLMTAETDLSPPAFKRMLDLRTYT